MYLDHFILVKSFYKPFGNAYSLETSSLKLKLIKFDMVITFKRLPKVADNCIHVWILNKLLPTDNVYKYDLNYAIVYYTKYKYVIRKVTS